MDTTQPQPESAAGISGRLRRLFRRYCILTEWNFGLVETPPAALTRLVTDGLLGTVVWCPRRSPLSSRADPFFWPTSHGPRVIYEEISSWSQRGHIRSITLDRFSKRQQPRLEIDRNFHLSYPFVIQVDDTWYCVPESARSGGVDLYAWEPRTKLWVLKRRLIEGIAILDATFFRYEGIWYLFGTVRGDQSYSKLRIWWSYTFEGNWQSHACDPAKVDVRSARPAGSWFEVDGRWYRPAQDCAAGYGSAVTINRLESLSPTEFSETMVCRVRPDPKGPYPDGLHTLGVYRGQVLIDGKKVRFSAALLLMNALRLVVRLPGRIAQKLNLLLGANPRAVAVSELTHGQRNEA